MTTGVAAVVGDVGVAWAEAELVVLSGSAFPTLVDLARSTGVVAEVVAVVRNSTGVVVEVAVVRMTALRLRESMALLSSGRIGAVADPCT